MPLELSSDPAEAFGSPHEQVTARLEQPIRLVHELAPRRIEVDHDAATEDDVERPLHWIGHLRDDDERRTSAAQPLGNLPGILVPLDEPFRRSADGIAPTRSSE